MYATTQIHPSQRSDQLGERGQKTVGSRTRLSCRPLAPASSLPSHTPKSWYNTNMSTHPLLEKALIGSVVILSGASGYLTYLHVTNTDRITMLLHERNIFLQQSSSTTKAFTEAQNLISEQRAELENIKEELENLADDYRDEKDKNEAFEDQIRDLAGTVGVLDKLAQIDEEILQPRVGNV